MTTLTHGSSLAQVATLLVTAALGVSASIQARTAQPKPPVRRVVPTTCPIPDQVTDNRYVLLLVFESAAESQAAAATLFPNSTEGALGCIVDPDDGSAFIQVQGACPTDCKRPTVDSKSSKAPKASNAPGDPLSKLEGDPIWAIFFADGAGAKEAADDDADTKLRVWTIAAKDSCHAGRIVRELHRDYPTVFTYHSGYIGDMMIGYHSPKMNHGTDSVTDCKPWTPPPPHPAPDSHSPAARASP